MVDTHADPRARASDSGTSFRAADSMKDVAGYQGGAVLRVLRNAWPEPLAAEQIATGINDMDHVSVNRRLADLARLGHVEKTEHLHLNRSGRKACKFGLVEAQARMSL